MLGGLGFFGVVTNKDLNSTLPTYWDDNPNHPMNEYMYRQALTIPSSVVPGELTDFREVINQAGTNLNIAHIFANTKVDGSDFAISINGEDPNDRYLYDWRPYASKFEFSFIRPTLSASDNYLWFYYGNNSATLTNSISHPAKWRSDIRIKSGIDLLGNSFCKDMKCILADNSTPAEYYNGKTYLAYIQTNQLILTRSYDHSISAWSDATTAASGAAFISGHTGHDVPDLVVINSGVNQGKILIAWTDGNKIYTRRSATAENITAWDTTVTAYNGSGTNEPNKPLLGQFSDGTLVIMTDHDTGDIGSFRDTLFLRSHDAGGSWTGGILFSAGESEYVQHKLFVDANDILHVVVEHQVTQSPFRCAVYYMKSDDKGITWKTRDGTTITPAIANMDLIYDPGSGYSGRCAELMTDANNNPIFVIEDSDTSTYANVLYAYWDVDLEDWITEIVGPSNLLTAPRQSCGGCFDPHDQNYIFISSATAFKIYNRLSPDNWILHETSLTSSFGKFFRPNRVANAPTDFKVMCTFSDSFTAGTNGWGNAQIFAYPLQKATQFAFNAWADDKPFDNRVGFLYTDSAQFDMAGAFTPKWQFKRAAIAGQEDMFARRDGTNGWVIHLDTSTNGVFRFVGITTSSSHKVDKKTTLEYDDNVIKYAAVHYDTATATSIARINKTSPSLTNNSAGTYTGVIDNNVRVCIGRRVVETNWFSGQLEYNAICTGLETLNTLDAECNNVNDMAGWYSSAGVEIRGEGFLS